MVMAIIVTMAAVIAVAATVAVDMAIVAIWVMFGATMAAVTVLRLSLQAVLLVAHPSEALAQVLPVATLSMAAVPA